MDPEEPENKYAGTDGSALTPERKEFLQGGMDAATKRMNELAGLQQSTDAFAGGVQGASRLNRDPGVRRAVTAHRSLARDYRLARREAIRRGDRLGAARISREASGAGVQTSGIGRYGQLQQAAAHDMRGGYSAAQQQYAGTLDPRFAQMPQAPVPVTYIPKDVTMSDSPLFSKQRSFFDNLA